MVYIDYNDEQVNETYQLTFVMYYLTLQVALQFSDASLPDSSYVCRHIADNTTANVFILADTSYGRYYNYLHYLKHI